MCFADPCIFPGLQSGELFLQDKDTVFFVYKLCILVDMFYIAKLILINSKFCNIECCRMNCRVLS